jgi:hypothetical protein
MLAKLCRTDRRCKRVAEELLYKELHSYTYGYDKAQAINYNPELAKNVKKFDIKFGVSFGTWPLSTSSVSGRINAEVARKVFVRALENAYNVRRISVREKDGLGTKRDELAQTLGWLKVFNNAVIESAAGSCNRFAHLKSLTIMTDVISAEEISCVFRMPSLEYLSLRGVYQTTPFENWRIPESG